jgi:hypothetical protein
MIPVVVVVGRRNGPFGTVREEDLSRPARVRVADSTGGELSNPSSWSMMWSN